MASYKCKVADVILWLMIMLTLNPFKGIASLNDYVKLCQGVGTESFKADLLAQAITGLWLSKFPQHWL